MGNARIGWGWIKDRFIRATRFHCLCHGIIAKIIMLGEVFDLFFLILTL
jgi:hypothetical protein